MNGNDLAGKWTTRDWRTELELELKTNILGFWMDKVPSAHDDGFVGEIGSDLAVREDADRSLVLNARILWTFAAAYRRYADPAYMDMADRAYRYLHEHFLDREHEGYYWAVRADGTPAETKKQVYGQAFVIYALSEYAQALDAAGSAADPQRREEASAQAQRLFGLIEAHSRDGRFGGYIEAHARDWSDTEDLSLSGKDLNEKKSMNTHLHVLEGYTNLYRIRPSDEMRLRLSELVEVTLKHIVDSSTGHFHLFFDEQWNVKSDHISYGHDIEGSWLLVEAAEVLGDEALLERVRHTALQMAQAVLERGLDTDGGLWNEAAGGRLIDDNKDWWPQAEAMVGFYNAYELTGSSAYLEAAQRSWAFIRDYIVDREHGEWYWSVSNNRVPNTKDAKVSAWKCPYHNSRACFEMLARLERLEAAGASSDTLFEQRKRKVTRSHEALLAKPNRKAEPGNGVYDRYIDPVLTAAHAPLIWKYDFNPATNPYFSERLGVGGAFNPGAIYLNGKYVLVARVEGADRKSFFAAAESDRPTEGFRFRDRPIRMPETAEPDINVYDMRLVQHEDGWIYGLFCTERRDPSAAPSDLSSAVAQCGIARTRDLEVWERLADLKTPSAQQRNVVLHPEFVDGKYAFHTRPQDGFIDAGSGGGIGWGLSDTIENAVIDREIIMDERAYHTIKEVKNGQGPAPIKTDKGWLHIAHGVRGTAAGLRYVLYAFLSDLAEPWKVTHRPGGHLLAPEGIERVGDVSNVLFCNGVTVNEAGEVHIYYASSDTRIHVAETSVDRLLDYVTNTPEDPLRSYACVEQRLELIERNLAYLEQQNR